MKYLANKEKARKFVWQKINYFNQFYNFEINRVAIRNQATRWGSCSQRGNLNFNYRILFLPPKMADYIVVHELCHLGQLNHSRDFLELVAKTLPDYKEIKKKFKNQKIIIE